MKDCASKQSQSQAVAQQLKAFVEPLLVMLDKRLDKRLVRTFLLTLCAIMGLITYMQKPHHQFPS